MRNTIFDHSLKSVYDGGWRLDGLKDHRRTGGLMVRMVMVMVMMVMMAMMMMISKKRWWKMKGGGGAQDHICYLIRPFMALFL